MKKILNVLLDGYRKFREKYINTTNSILKDLYLNGQSPKVMVVACCDSRVDPALLLQCDPGDLFVVRNIANIVPPYEKDSLHHGTSAALEFGIKVLKIKHLIIFGHSQCGGIKTWINNKNKKRKSEENLEFVDNWVSIIDISNHEKLDVDNCAKHSLINSYNNCFTFPWIKERAEQKKLLIHLWFFDIKTGRILFYDHERKTYNDLLFCV